jgi:hypothetical protein
MVAPAAGSIKRKVRRKEERARLVKAVSAWFARANLRGFRELTKPRRTKKTATHEWPMATSRKGGRWKRSGVLSSWLQQGGMRMRAKHKTR